MDSLASTSSVNDVGGIAHTLMSLLMDRILLLDSSESRIMPSMLLYSRRDTYAPISAMLLTCCTGIVLSFRFRSWRRSVVGCEKSQRMGTHGFVFPVLVFGDRLVFAHGFKSTPSMHSSMNASRCSWCLVSTGSCGRVSFSFSFSIVFPSSSMISFPSSCIDDPFLTCTITTSSTSGKRFAYIRHGVDIAAAVDVEPLTPSHSVSLTRSLLQSPTLVHTQTLFRSLCLSAGSHSRLSLSRTRRCFLLLVFLCHSPSLTRHLSRSLPTFMPTLALHVFPIDTSLFFSTLLPFSSPCQCLLHIHTKVFA